MSLEDSLFDQIINSMGTFRIFLSKINELNDEQKNKLQKIIIDLELLYNEIFLN